MTFRTSRDVSETESQEVKIRFDISPEAGNVVIIRKRGKPSRYD